MILLQNIYNKYSVINTILFPGKFKYTNYALATDKRNYILIYSCKDVPNTSTKYGEEIGRIKFPILVLEESGAQQWNV